jgi:ParB family chromosome partitioning protein
VDDDLSVRQVEDIVRQLNEPQPLAEKAPKVSKEGKESLPGEFNKYKNQLRDIFNSKVELRRDHSGAGKIVIPFSTDIELIQIMHWVEKVKNLE